MRHVVVAILLACWTPALSRAEDNDDSAEQEVAREIGAVLAWRLGPEAVEEACQGLDPGGAEARKKALANWLDKNDALIRTVDARVAEVVPLIYSPPPKVDAVQAVRKQVKEILLEPMLADKTTEEVIAICKAEADPAGRRWNDPGMPHVQLALATLSDWQTQHTAKK
jgi:hypothetical protein